MSQLSTGEWIFILFVVLMLMFSIISNMLVLVIVYRNKRMVNVTNTFICNLAISDILLAGFVLPPNIHDISHEQSYYEGEFLCKFVNSFPILCITSSIYTLVGISFERRKAIAESAQKQWTVRKVVRILPLKWIFAVAMSIPTMVEFSVNDVYDNQTNNTHKSCGNAEVPRMFVLMNGIAILFMSYIIPLLLIWNNYAKLAWFVLKKAREVTNTTRGDANSNKSTTSFILFRKRVKIVKMLILVAVLFAVSWLPYFVSMITMKVTGEDDSENAGSSLNLVKIFLATFSTAYNVVLYVIFNINFRCGFRSILSCYSKHRSNSFSISIIERSASMTGN